MFVFQVPIFVLTHHVPEKGAKGEKDKLTLTFVTDGIESAIEKAKAAAQSLAHNVTSSFILLSNTHTIRLIDPTT